jgi:hypothetical protein
MAIVASAVFAILVLGLSAYMVHANSQNELKLSPTSGSLTPGASGTVEFSFSNGVLVGQIEAQSLPAQGSQLAYVAWFVNTDTGDKAFLGPLVQDGGHTILFQTQGNGLVAFSVSKFTSGPDAGSQIMLASSGHNLFIVLVENNINFASPSPIGSAVSATF